jgi:hypothetical protein
MTALWIGTEWNVECTTMLAGQNVTDAGHQRILVRKIQSFHCLLFLAMKYYFITCSEQNAT